MSSFPCCAKIHVRFPTIITMRVNIIYPKDDWYLQHTAEQLITRMDAEYRRLRPLRPSVKRLACRLLDKKSYTDVASFEVPSASRKTVNYYINYHLFKKKSRDIDVGHFTHPEPNGEFDRKAARMDYAVCMSDKYVNYLRDKGVLNCSRITPGVDEFFRPKLVLGWFGSLAYGTRKGRDLFDKVKELDFVDLRLYSGLKRSELPAAYGGCDYVLITSRYEGGPMSILEGIACGKKIICPLDVGLASGFGEAIIPYQNSDWNSLRGVLESLYREKENVAALVKGYTWDEFFRKHMELFRELAGG